MPTVKANKKFFLSTITATNIKIKIHIKHWNIKFFRTLIDIISASSCIFVSKTHKLYGVLKHFYAIWNIQERTNAKLNRKFNRFHEEKLNCFFFQLCTYLCTHKKNMYIQINNKQTLWGVHTVDLVDNCWKKCNKTFIWRKKWHFGNTLTRKNATGLVFIQNTMLSRKNTPGKPNEFEPESVLNCEKNGKDWHNHECFSLRCNSHLNNFDGPKRGRRESEQFHNVQTLMPDSFQAHQNSRILYKTCLSLPLLLFPCIGQC